jgi:hypothetical protein
MTRFTLNKPEAREWLAHTMRHAKGGCCDNTFLPEGIASDYTARTDRYDGSVTHDVLQEALRAGIITDTLVDCPGSRANCQAAEIWTPALSLWHDAPSSESEADDDDYGYHWAVKLNPGNLDWDAAQVVTGFAPYVSFGPELRGAELAMTVLVEATGAGNALCAQLVAYAKAARA